MCHDKIIDYLFTNCSTKPLYPKIYSQTICKPFQSNVQYDLVSMLATISKHASKIVNRLKYIQHKKYELSKENE